MRAEGGPATAKAAAPGCHERGRVSWVIWTMRRLPPAKGSIAVARDVVWFVGGQMVAYSGKQLGVSSAGGARHGAVLVPRKGPIFVLRGSRISSRDASPGVRERVLATPHQRSGRLFEGWLAANWIKIRCTYNHACFGGGFVTCAPRPQGAQACRLSATGRRRGDVAIAGALREGELGEDEVVANRFVVFKLVQESKGAGPSRPSAAGPALLSISGDCN